MTTIRKRTRTSPPARASDVGYGKPPVHSQFQPGQSGNPRGRPRRNLLLNPILERALKQKVPVLRNGIASSIPLLEAIVEKAILDAVKGNNAARKQVLDLNRLRELAAIEALAVVATTEEPELDPVDQAILEQFRQEVLKDAELLDRPSKPSTPISSNSSKGNSK
jgi:hypothetical protein